MSVKKIPAGEGGWTYAKEVLGWILDMEAGVVTLPERKLEDILTLVDISNTQCIIVRKDLEGLVGNLCSMHIMVPGVVVHLYQILHTINQGGVDRVWLYPALRRDLAD